MVRVRHFEMVCPNHLITQKRAFLATPDRLYGRFNKDLARSGRGGSEDWVQQACELSIDSPAHSAFSEPPDDVIHEPEDVNMVL